jgi:hypothetical protein
MTRVISSPDWKQNKQKAVESSPTPMPARHEWKRRAWTKRTVHLDDGVLNLDSALLGNRRRRGGVAPEWGAAEHAAGPGDREAARGSKEREAGAAGGV